MRHLIFGIDVDIYFFIRHRMWFGYFFFIQRGVWHDYITEDGTNYSDGMWVMTAHWRYRFLPAKQIRSYEGRIKIQ